MSNVAGRAAAACIGLLEEALYPSHVACALCNQEALLDEQRLCTACAGSLLPCGELAAPPPLSGLYAAYQYKGGAVAGIHALKYSNQTRLAPFFADAIDLPPEWEIDAVVPVPLHPLKQWLRTYNQSELIAKALSKRLHLTLNPRLLRRTRFTQTQTALDEFERAKNVARAFSASPAAKGLNVLLIDDVTTTHSTLLACAVALKQAGANRVYAACACSAGKDVE
jgi:ComF family protein